MSFEAPQEGSEEEKTPEYWMERAQDKVLSFLPDLDMDLEVGVEVRRIHPYNGNPYDGIVLSFKREKEPSIAWTMDIGQDEDYIENRLELAVRKIYAQQIAEADGEDGDQ